MQGIENESFIFGYYCVDFAVGLHHLDGNRTQKEPDENLIGFYINSKNGVNHIYVIGERNEYLFYENKVFSAFLKSNHLNHTVFTNAEISYSASNSALIDYNVYFRYAKK
ncbi:hypothetical protein [Neisseria wadsworthii]|uniref:Uncharacterized protein n=1 Tax=Neisseria wadsworthii 9715 TaxID=1030841 RepID=G4CRA4_9NEIS|nr:hypothetical protein [Neisseria wadsworthii]EGZ45517.1 hypothetical protein HMPREF9370_1614 [Neisseria wadsworthii 9715]QMT35316.1 hypothetical protein H3L96_09735 [Neisseria wadsworthii]